MNATLELDNNNNADTVENTETLSITPANVDRQSSRFAQAWDKSPSRIFSAAKAAEELKAGGLPVLEVVETLKAAIAREHAKALGRGDDVALIADMVQGVRLSTSAVSQLTNALARSRQAKSFDANTVSAFYNAALNYVSASELKRIAADAGELETGHAEFVAECIVVARADAGAARRAKRAPVDKAAKSSSDESTIETDSAVSVTKHGAAAFTLADILRAAESVAADETDKGAAAVRAIAQRIVAELAN